MVAAHVLHKLSARIGTYTSENNDAEYLLRLWESISKLIMK